MRCSDLDGKRVLVLGTGREIRAFAEAMHPRFAELLAVDARDGATAREWRETWGDRAPLTIALTGAGFASRIDVAVSSPGIPPHDPLRTSLTDAGIPVTMPPELWLGEHAAATTGVTGSKGKSTTSALIHSLARAHGVDAQLGGNIGVSLFSLPPAERYVAEFSSYQASSLTVSPDVAVLTSLFPEHLDWHGSVAAYYDAKLTLVAHGPRRVVVNAEDELLETELARRYPGLPVERVGPGSNWALDSGWIRRAGEPFVPTSGWRIAGRHNVLNAALALAALEASGVEPDAGIAGATLREFAPLEHRLEQIPDPSGVVFVDDSLSTAPQAAIRALEAFRDRPVVLLLGGHGRGVDYAPLAEYLSAHPIVALVGLPGSGPELLERLAGAGIPGELADDMDDAVARARRLTPAGGAVLLSPAAPSYGRYADYRARGADFRRAVAATTPG